MNWVRHLFGLDSASGQAYLAWSGALSDLGELAIIGGLITVYRKHVCEVKGCPRIARHATAAAHHVCRRHMPGGAPTHADVIAAHEAAKRGRGDHRRR